MWWTPPSIYRTVVEDTPKVATVSFTRSHDNVLEQSFAERFEFNPIRHGVQCVCFRPLHTSDLYYPIDPALGCHFNEKLQFEWVMFIEIIKKHAEPKIAERVMLFYEMLLYEWVRENLFTCRELHFLFTMCRALRPSNISIEYEANCFIISVVQHPMLWFDHAMKKLNMTEEECLALIRKRKAKEEKQLAHDRKRYKKSLIKNGVQQ